MKVLIFNLVPLNLYFKLMNKKITVGIIGIGIFSLDFAQRSADAGYKVFISSLDSPHTFKNAVEKMGKNDQTATIQKAGSADFVFIFTAKEKEELLMKSLPNLKGKIVVYHRYLTHKDDYTSELLNIASPVLRHPSIEENNIINIYSNIAKSNGSETDHSSLYYAARTKAIAEKAKFLLLSLNLTALYLVNILEDFF